MLQLGPAWYSTFSTRSVEIRQVRRQGPSNPSLAYPYSQDDNAPTERTLIDANVAACEKSESQS